MKLYRFLFLFIAFFCTHAQAQLELRPGQTITIDNNNSLEDITHEEAVTIYTSQGDNVDPITLNVAADGIITQTTTQNQAQQNFDPQTPQGNFLSPANCAVFVNMPVGAAPFTLNLAGHILGSASQPSDPTALYYSPTLFLAGNSTLNHTGTITGDILIAEGGSNNVIININGGDVNGHVFTTASFGDVPSQPIGRLNFNGAFTTAGDFKGFSQTNFNSHNAVNVGHVIDAGTITLANNAHVNLVQGGVLQSNNDLINNGTLTLSGGAIHAPITGLGNLTIAHGNFSTQGNITGQTITINSNLNHPNTTFILNANHTITSNNDIQLQGASTLRINGGTIAANIVDDGAGIVDIHGPFVMHAGNSLQASTIEVNRLNTNASLTLGNNTPISGFDALTIYPQGNMTIASNVTSHPNGVLTNRGQMTMTSGTLTSSALNNAGQGSLTLIGGTIVPRVSSSEQALFTMTGGNLNNGLSNTGTGKVEIRGGTIDGAVVNHHQDGILALSGGTFNGSVNNRGKLIIQGGVFNDRITHDAGVLELNAALLQVEGGLVNNATLVLNGKTVVEGDFTQNRGATLASTIHSPVKYDKLQVNGKTIIQPGSNLALTLSNPKQIREGDVFEIVSSKEGVLSPVEIVLAENSPYTFNQTSHDNQLKLTAVRSYYLSTMATSPHAEVVADAIEDQRFINTDPQFEKLINFLDNSHPQDLNNTLLSLAPNHTRGLFYSGMVPINTSINKAFMRLELHRRGVDLVENGYSSGDFLGGDGSFGPIILMNNMRQADQTHFQGFKAATEGFGVLADGMVTDCFQLGAGLVYSGTRVRTKHDSGKTMINSSEALVYGGVQNGPAFFDLSLVAAHNRYHIKRDIITGFVSCYSKHRGFQFAGKLRTGIDIPACEFLITPVAMIQHTRLHQNKFVERSIITRNTASQNSHLTQAGVGFKFSYIELADCYVPEAHILYLRDLNNPKLQVTSTFTGAGAAFTLIGPVNQYRNSINVGGSLAAFIAEDVFLNLGYDYEGKKKFHSHSAAMRIRWLF